MTTDATVEAHNKKDYPNGSTPMVTLDALERIGLLGMLPNESDVFTLKIIRDLKDHLGLSEQELEQLAIRQGSINVEVASAITKDIPMGEKASEIVRACLQELSNQKKLGIHCLTLYERFVEGHKNGSELEE